MLIRVCDNGIEGINKIFADAGLYRVQHYRQSLNERCSLVNTGQMTVHVVANNP